MPTPVPFLFLFERMWKMEPVKIYQNIDAENSAMNFGISRMADIYTRRAGQAEEPHRQNHYTGLIIRQASGRHKTDFHTYPLYSRQVFRIAGAGASGVGVREINWLFNGFQYSISGGKSESLSKLWSSADEYLNTASLFLNSTMT